MVDDADAMSVAFNTLKNSLKEAAEAAGASLQALIEVPVSSLIILAPINLSLNTKVILSNFFCTFKM